jgi:hypothetical protein
VNNLLLASETLKPDKWKLWNASWAKTTVPLQSPILENLIFIENH